MSPLRRAWARFRSHRLAVAAACIVAALALAALFAPLLAPADPLAQPDPVALQNQPPSAEHILGTDRYSRDVLSRLLYGARVSLGIGAAAALLAVTLGAGVGLAAGLASPAVDQLLMRSVDVAFALPRVFLILLVLALWEDAPAGAIVVLIAVTGWFRTSRVVRALVLQLREAEFVQAARALGAGGTGLVRRHLLPHVAPAVIVSATLDVGNIVLLESGLSYLGLGVRAPAPSWGNMILEGKDQLFTAPWVAAAPGLALLLTVVAFNLAGDGMQDALDPRRER
ncbi:MAG: ABC transporter permease [Gemmatimonadota bacterium]